MMLQTQPLAFTVILALLALIVPTLTHAQTCSRESSDKGKTPDFVCQFNVTFQRQTDCSAFITESFILPHTNGIDFRIIPVLDDLQGISNVSVTRNGDNITDTTKVSNSNRDNQLQIEIRSSQTPDPVLFVVRYEVSNAVLRFTDACGLDESPNEDRNVMRWRLENFFEQRYENIMVTFQTDNENATLAVLGDVREEPESDAQMQTVLLRNVDDTREIYAEEDGVSLCLQDQRCFRDGPNVGVIVGLSVAGAAVGIVILACVIGCCCTRRLRKRYEEAQQEGEA